MSDAAVAADEEAPMQCLHCGQPEIAELLEVWDYREFALETCCEGMHEAVADFLAEDPRRAAHWLGGKGLNELHRTAARRIIDDAAGQLVIGWNLEVVAVTQREAKRFVETHHRHCRPPAGWRFGAAARNGQDIVAVAMVGRPVARMIDHTKVVEVNRMCTREDLPAGLAWNACSLLYGWAAREAKRRGFEHAITYTLRSEPGTTLRAAGWTPGRQTIGRSWDTPSRPRQHATIREDKLRWSRTLVAAPTYVLA